MITHSDLETIGLCLHLVTMKTNDQIPHLEGKLLIAMPAMGDPRFERSVIFMCSHSAEGAMGIIVNKPAPELRFKDLLDQLKIKGRDETALTRVYFGGPVEHGRGFVLHAFASSGFEPTLKVDDVFGMTATLDILEDIAAGTGPTQSLLALGYAGWGPGQLESEIQENGWLTCDASPELVFSTKDDAKWEAALHSLGIDPRFLSAEGGSA